MGSVHSEWPSNYKTKGDNVSIQVYLQISEKPKE